MGFKVWDLRFGVSVPDFEHVVVLDRVFAEELHTYCRTLPRSRARARWRAPSATLTSRGTGDCVDLKGYRRFPGRTGFDENDNLIWSKKRVTEIGHGSTGNMQLITALGRNIYDARYRN